MKYKLLSYLVAWIFPTKKDRAFFRLWCKNLDIKQKAPIVRKRYKDKIEVLKNKEKIRVLFLVSEISKWKTQTLFDLLKINPKYEPIIALTLGDFQWKLPKDKKIEILYKNKEFFESKGMECVLAYDIKKHKAIPLDKFDADLVFYQQPWRIASVHLPENVSKYALTFYVPYFVPNYGKLDMDCQQELHKTVLRYYTLDKEYEIIYRKAMIPSIGRPVGLGHTALDFYYLNKNYKPTKKYVIYAPHHSINNFENYSTFLDNGKEILEYAKKHPEINWAFKPHPTLKYRLIKDKVMAEDEVKNYYNEWEKIATCCYTSDYSELFLESKALITDSASFLVEYFCTKKPVIHLISDKCKIKPIEPFKRIIDTFYKVHNLDEMYKVFDDILIKNDDYNKKQRLKVLKDSGLNDNYAAKNIIDDIEGLINCKN